MNNETCEVVITAPDADWLAEFTRELVEARLAAVGHNIAPVRSIYNWQGQVFDTTEARVILHTRRSLVDRISELTRQSHPFEVPCIIATPIINGNPEYLQWITNETTQDQ